MKKKLADYISTQGEKLPFLKIYRNNTSQSILQIYIYRTIKHLTSNHAGCCGLMDNFLSYAFNFHVISQLIQNHFELTYTDESDIKVIMLHSYIYARALEIVNDVPNL